MDKPLWIAIALIAVGTYAMRLVPMLLMQHRLKKHQGDNPVEAVPELLTILGPLMIAAMLGITLIPKTLDITHWLAAFIGCVATLITWRFTRSLGVPVVVGVLVYGGVVFGG